MEQNENEYTSEIREEMRSGEPVPACESAEPQIAETVPAETVANEPEVTEAEPEAAETVSPETEKKTKRQMRLMTLGICIAMLGVCVITAILVSKLWQKKYMRLEMAIQDRFDAIEQTYGQKKEPVTDTPLPEQGVMPPSQIYAENVQAVVAISTADVTVGTGFIVSADGYIVTNCHVIEDATNIKAITNDGIPLVATIVGKDAANDVALLKVPGENLPYVKIGSSDALAVGDMVVAIGTPLGELNSTLTVGYVSAKDRVVNTDGTVISMLQTDAAINSGNSGGPLFNTYGEVIGITTAKYSGDSASGATIEGLGFAIPMDDVEGILSDLKEYGYVTGAYLGVSVRDVDTSYQSLPAGAYVTSVVRGGAAAKAGIRAGDVIVTLGGYDIDSVSTLTRILRRFEAGETVSVIVYRDGQREPLTIVLEEKPTQ